MKKIAKVIFLAAILLILPLFKGINADAISISEIENKTYTAEFTGGNSMVRKNFEPTVLIERIDDYYYVSFTQKSSSIVGLTIKVDNKDAGSMVRSENGEIKTITFTLSKENLMGKLHFEAYVKAMASDVDFDLEIDETTIALVKDSVDNIPNRPGFFGERPDFEKTFPIWGYALIVVGALGVGAAIIVIARKKHKKEEK